MEVKSEFRGKMGGIARIFVICAWCWVLGAVSAHAQGTKEPNVAGAFYPAAPGVLERMVDSLIKGAGPSVIDGHIGVIIVPHAGYEYSGATAASAYRELKGRSYRTVVVIAPAHYFAFSGVSVYPSGYFRTPFGDLAVDAEFSAQLLASSADLVFEPRAFEKEHSLEVQLPFLQGALVDFKIVPVIVGDAQLPALKNLAERLAEIIADREDVLLVISTDLYHGYDYSQASAYDRQKIDYMISADPEGLYRSLRDEGSPRMCGGFAVCGGLIYARAQGYQFSILSETTSAEVTGRKAKGEWSVGYAALAGVRKETGSMMKEKGQGVLFNDAQRKRLLEIARFSIEQYLANGRKLSVQEADPLLNEQMGAFVTLHSKEGELRGCIGQMVGDQPLYLTVRDMAVEAALHDPRFPPVKPGELPDLEIEISALSPLKKVSSAEQIQMGIHGVMVRRGFSSGVYLPQVARDTGWSKEQFLNSLCAQKAGLPPDAWKDPRTDIYVFSAEVFSESKH